MAVSRTGSSDRYPSRRPARHALGAHGDSSVPRCWAAAPAASRRHQMMARVYRTPGCRASATWGLVPRDDGRRWRATTSGRSIGRSHTRRQRSSRVPCRPTLPSATPTPLGRDAVSRAIEAARVNRYGASFRNDCRHCCGYHGRSAAMRCRGGDRGNHNCANIYFIRRYRNENARSDRSAHAEGYCCYGALGSSTRGGVISARAWCWTRVPRFARPRSRIMGHPVGVAVGT